MNKINLLWTGGLDSTFRLVELAHQNIEIQPYYIIDEERSSRANEEAAMNKILNLLRQKSFTKAIINDVRYISMDSVKEDTGITNAYNFFHQFNKMGSQYDFLARFADQNNLVLEVGLEGSERSKASQVLKKFGSLNLHSYNNLNDPKNTSWDSFYAIDKNEAHPFSKKVFGNLRFPAHLFNIEKIEEAKILNEWQCKDILMTTWFCHKPVLGYPCGRCNPCKDALNEGFAWRVPLKGRILGTIRYYIQGIARKVNDNLNQ